MRSVTFFTTLIMSAVLTRPLLTIRRVHEVSKMLDYLVGSGEGSRNYDKTLRPNFGGSPVIVGVTINVDSLGPIDEVNMNFRLDLSFRQFWKDSRLDFSLYHQMEDTYDQNLTLSHDFLTKIWVPDTYFPESLRAFKQDVMVPNVLIRLSPDGSILYSSRTTVIAKCPMDLHVFPMDTQVCSLLVECYGYTTKDLSLQWKDGNASVDITGDRQLAQFKVIDHKLLNYTLKFSTGSFSDLEIEFVFKRDLLYFILQSYIPSTLIVVCSWVAFWINREGIPGRACLSITTVLSLITLIGSTNAKLPNVSAVKALDVYFGICFGYVFGGLLEFATVIYLGSKEKKRAAAIKEKKEKQTEYLSTINNIRSLSLLQELDPYLVNDLLKDSVKSPLHLTSNLSTDGLSTNAQLLSPITSADIMQSQPKTPRWTASRIEVYSRIWFPTSFVTLFAFYWLYYYVIKADYYLKTE